MGLKPNKYVTAENERSAWLMRQKCMTETSIAEELGVEQSTVSRMLARVNSRLSKEFTARALEMKTEQTAQLQYIAAEAMRMWEQSEGEVVIKRENVKQEVAYDEATAEDGKRKQPRYLLNDDGSIVKGEDGHPVNQLITTERTSNTETKQQLGDPRYLAEARAALEGVRKIWGLDTAKDDLVVAIQKAYINVPVDDV